MASIVHPGSLVQTKTRRKAQVRKRRNVSLRSLALFIAGITFGSAFLTLFLRFGCVLAIEYAQMCAKNAMQRCESAQKEASILRRELDAATNVAAIREWAEINGFRLSSSIGSGVEKG